MERAQIEAQWLLRVAQEELVQHFEESQAGFERLFMRKKDQRVFRFAEAQPLQGPGMHWWYLREV